MESPLTSYLARNQITQREFARICGIPEYTISRRCQTYPPGAEEIVTIQRHTGGAVTVEQWAEWARHLRENR